MPGPVIEGHAEYEESCDKCHTDAGEAEDHQALCNDCHEEVKLDVDEGSGYHGRIVGIKDRNCRSCHSDHLGRDADIVLLVPHNLPHEQTDFALKGRHIGLNCSACHEDGKKHREAKTECIDCHRDDDSHDGNLEEKCQDCHSSFGWKEKLEFDHDKTDFKLTGEHPKVKCLSCHPADRYKDIPKECVSCHSSNDSHRGDLGKKCDSCHTTEKWDKNKFDHERESEFKLRDAHKELKCTQCHTSGVTRVTEEKNNKSEKVIRDCVACHSTDDLHQRGHGKDCNSCHKETKWDESSFDHKEKSGYALLGKHEKLKCSSCHSAPIYEVALENSCYVCHKRDDVHKEPDARECEQCHSESGWNQKLRFDHDLTQFPLNGLHTSVVCEECHINQQYQNTETGCINCHQQDDIHKDTLGKRCADCHNPNGWPVWFFNHDEQTDFTLLGKHKGLACEGCHQRTSSKGMVKISTQCVACHREDDVHHGSYGLQCDRCHVNESFTDLQLMQ